jgi:hypothetical protein
MPPLKILEDERIFEEHVVTAEEPPSLKDKAKDYAEVGDPDAAAETLKLGHDEVLEIDRAEILAEAYRNRATLLQTIADSWRALDPGDPRGKHIGGLTSRLAQDAKSALRTAKLYEIWAASLQLRTEADRDDE